MKYYCHLSSSPVSLWNVDLLSEERSNVQLLFLLYVCLFWRGEAKQLGIHLSFKSFQPTARNELAGGFFVLHQTSFECRSMKRRLANV